MIFAPQQKLASHPSFAKYLAGEMVPIINVEVSPSSLCNAKCVHCFYRTDKNKKEKFIRWAELMKFLVDGSQNGLEAVTWSGGGEPTLHPHFCDLVMMVSHQTKLYQGLFTNALARPEYPAYLLKWIRVTKTDKPWPENNIKELRRQNCNVGLAVNYRGKEDDIDVRQGLRLAHNYDLRYVQVRPALNIMGHVTFIEPPDIEDSKLVALDYKWSECQLRDRRYTNCEGFHFSPMVWENGMMSACMYMRHHKKYDIGSIYEHGFTELCRKMPQSLSVAQDCQVCCKNNEINRLISDCKKLEDRSFV
jgi:organic radical activating enzyme